MKLLVEIDFNDIREDLKDQRTIDDNIEELLKLELGTDRVEVTLLRFGE